MPVQWNGRLVFQGGGGMNGFVGPAYGGNFNPQSTYPSALARGFAIVSTDTGHVAKHGADASFARDQQAKLKYAYAATGKTYDAAARALGTGTAAQLVSPAEGQLIRTALLNRCDALDGARDGMIFDHAACRFDVRELSCKPGQKAGACLAPAKVEAIARAFDGPLGASGKSRFTPWTWDASVFTPEWLSWQTGTVKPDGSVDTGLRDLVASSLTEYFAFPAIASETLGGSSQDVERLMRATETTAGLTAATSTDFTTFAARGGKLMLIDGWSDPIFSARDLVRWHERMAQDMAQVSGMPADGFARLFMVPGMAHCAGGRALDDMDGLGALVRWVEMFDFKGRGKGIN